MIEYSRMFGFDYCSSKKPVYELENYSVMQKVCRDKIYYEVQSCSCGEEGRSCSPVSKVIQNYESLEQAKEEADRLQHRADQSLRTDDMKKHGYYFSKKDYSTKNNER